MDLSNGHPNPNYEDNLLKKGLTARSLFSNPADHLIHLFC